MFKKIDREGSYSVKYDLRIDKFDTEDVIPLWVADMDLASPKCITDRLTNRASHPIYGYTIYPDEYYQSIQHWMKSRFDWHIDRDWIVPCYGVVPSINFAISAYTSEGDSIIVQTPLYPPFVSSIRHKHRVVLDNVLIYKDGKYSIDFDDFAIKAKEAKMFMLCSPHNPTSRAWDEDELEKIIDICIAEDVIILSDEIHSDIVYKKLHHSIGSFEKIQDRCIILNAPSKTFNIAGLNTSYAIIPNRRKRKIYILEQDKSGITNGNPFGIEAIIGAYREGHIWLDNLKLHLQSNIDYVNKTLITNNIPIKSLTTEATFLMWLDCRDMKLSQQEIVEFFVYKARLGLNDGKSFGEAGDGFMRLNIGTSKEILEEAMDRLCKAYEELS